MTALTKEPLPPVIELGRSMTAIDEEYYALDDARTGREPTCDEEKKSELLDRQVELLQELISTLPAVTLADAAVQLNIARRILGTLDACDWSRKEAQPLLDRQHRMAYRLVLSALPLVAKSAGLGA